jgi:flagellar biosynthesis chaperone FliJ
MSAELFTPQSLFIFVSLFAGFLGIFLNVRNLKNSIKSQVKEDTQWRTQVDGKLDVWKDATIRIEKSLVETNINLKNVADKVNEHSVILAVLQNERNEIRSDIQEFKSEFSEVRKGLERVK